VRGRHKIGHTDLVLDSIWRYWMSFTHIKDFGLFCSKSFQGSFLFVLNWLRRKVFITYLTMKWNYLDLCSYHISDGLQHLKVTCSFVQVTTN
jgi:hypothetical protein